MKVIISLLLLVTLVACSVYGALWTPYHFYSTYLKKGIKGDLLTLEKPLPNLLKFNLQLRDKSLTRIDSDKMWTDIHYLDFVIPFPLDHPAVKLIPKPYITNKKIVVAYDLYDSSDLSIFKFNPLKTSHINLSTPYDKLFRIALVRKYINGLSFKKIWTDLFLKDLTFDTPNYLSPSSLQKLYKKMSPVEVAYRLYIYKLRQRLLPKSTKNIIVANDQHILIKTTGGNSKKFTTYIGFLLMDQTLYNYQLKVDESKKISRIALARFLKTLEIKVSQGRISSENIYNSFKTLPYQQRISYNGLMYLYAGWSHGTEQEDYIRELIQFVERGKGMEKYLFGLYAFAREKWGTTFSGKGRYLDETGKRKLERKVKEEQEREEKELSSIEDVETEFSSEEEKIKYFIKRAKDRKKVKSNDKLIED